MTSFVLKDARLSLNEEASFSFALDDCFGEAVTDFKLAKRMDCRVSISANAESQMTFKSLSKKIGISPDSYYGLLYNRYDDYGGDSSNLDIYIGDEQFGALRSAAGPILEQKVQIIVQLFVSDFVEISKSVSQALVEFPPSISIGKIEL